MRQTLFPSTTCTKKLHHFHRQEDFEAEITLSIITQDAKNCRDEDEVRMGILLQYSDPDDGSLLEAFNGITNAMFDPIRWTRAMWVLEALTIIDDMLFGYDLFWGIGHEASTLFQWAAERVRQAVGDQAYQEIMARPIPKHAIDLLIRLADEGQNVSPSSLTSPRKSTRTPSVGVRNSSASASNIPTTGEPTRRLMPPSSASTNPTCVPTPPIERLPTVGSAKRSA